MRNLLIIGGVCIVAILAGVILYTWGAHHALAPVTTAAASGEKSIPFQVLDSGTNASAMSSRTNYAIYTSAEFADFWKKAHGADGKTPPPIDFSKNYVIGVFAGTVPSGGYSIKVASITDTDDTRSVTVVINEPGANCSTVEEQTSPYEFVSVPVSNASALSHTDEHVPEDCTSEQ